MVTPDSSVPHGAFAIPIICTEQLKHTQDSPQRQVDAQQLQGEDVCGAKVIPYELEVLGEQNPCQPCSLKTNSIHFNITSFLVHLVKWENRGISLMRIIPNYHHLKFNVGRAGRNYVGI